MSAPGLFDVFSAGDVLRPRRAGLRQGRFPRPRSIAACWNVLTMFVRPLPASSISAAARGDAGCSLRRYPQASALGSISPVRCCRPPRPAQHGDAGCPVSHLRPASSFRRRVPKLPFGQPVSGWSGRSLLHWLGRSRSCSQAISAGNRRVADVFHLSRHPAGIARVFRQTLRPCPADHRHARPKRPVWWPAALPTR